MVNLPGRNNRRRRVLKEEVLSASSNHAALRASTDAGTASDGPRYSDAAGVENHPQITDFVPRRYGTIALLVLIGLGSTATLAALHFFAFSVAVTSGMQSTAALELTSYGGLAAWVSAIVMLLASATCLLTYSIRRHRIDDYRGRYRVWLGAALACFVVSANSVVGIHQILADVLSHFTGWTALQNGAVWWLLLAGLPFGWIAFRALLDMRECRVAGMLLLAAIASYAASIASFLGLVAIADPRVNSLTIGATALLGNWLLLAAAVSYARFVVLDAQGLISVRHRAVAKRVVKTEAAKASAEPSSTPVTKSAPSVLSAGGYSRSAPQPAKIPADSSRWLDGSRPERKRYEDDEEEDGDSSGDSGKVSKADRKKLRKLKAQGRAA